MGEHWLDPTYVWPGLGAALVGCVWAVGLTWRPPLGLATLDSLPTLTPQEVLPVPQSPEHYLDGIMRRNLFDEDVIAAWVPEEATPERRTVAKLDVILVGTVVTRPAALSTALIRFREGGRTEVFGMGAKVQDHHIIRIDPRQLTLLAPNGQQVAVTVSGAAAIPPPSAPAPAIDPGLVQQLENEKFAIDASIVDDFTLDKFARQSQVVPVMEDGGTMRGFTMAEIKPGSVPAQVGFENGDLLVGVNGDMFKENPDPSKLFGGLPGQSSFCVNLIRRGRPTELCFEVK